MKKYFKKMIIAICGILFIISLFIGFKIVINKNFIKNYPNTFNQEYRLLLMSIFNIYEPYVAEYNYGNYYYKEERYAEAVEKYKKALTRDVPKSKICDIEINLSLSLMQLAARSYDEEAIAYLNDAKSHLNNCINMDLEDVIAKEKEELEKARKEVEDGKDIDNKDDANGGPNKDTMNEKDSDKQLGSDEGKEEGSGINKEGQGDSGDSKGGKTPGGEASEDGKGNNPTGNDGGQGAEGDGNGENGSDGKGDGQGDGGGGNNNSNTNSHNNGSGDSGNGNVDGSGKGDSSGGNGNNGKGDNSSGNADGGANGQGTSDETGTGNGTGSNNGMAGSYSGKTTEQKQKDAFIMEGEVSEEINNLLEQLNAQKQAAEKGKNIEIDEKIDKLREENQKAMNLKEISFEQIMQAKVNQAKSIAEKSSPGLDEQQQMAEAAAKAAASSGKSIPTINLNPKSTGSETTKTHEPAPAKPKFGCNGCW